MAGRLIAYVVLVLLVGAGLWLGAGGDGRMRLFTAAVFGSCALGLAWKLWSSRHGAAPPAAAPLTEPDAEMAAPSGPWRVYGHDTFAREDYFIGEFDTEAEAREVVRQKLERLAKFQDEPLRDEIWVERPNSRFRMDRET